MKLSEPLIINFAPNGMVPTKDQTAHVPISAQEIIDDIFTCAELGATMIHVHARNADGTPSSDPERFAQIFEPVRRAKPELVLIATTSGRRTPELERRAAVLDLAGLCKPDMASLTLSSMNFFGAASVNAPDTVTALAAKMKEHNIRPELEVFDVGMVNFAKHLIRKGLLDPPYFFNILLGNIATAQASLLHLATIVHDLPEGSVWSVAGIGNAQLPVNALGCVYADGIRVGIEDNFWFDQQRKRLATNRELVGRVVELTRVLGRPIASSAETRLRLGLQRAGG
jgi:uncharacterized protein (DUF849 family)